MTRTELLVMIGDGEYGSSIPDDDETSELLRACVEDGLIRSEPSRIDDFFSLTGAGNRFLRQNDSPITSRLSLAR